MRVALFCFGFIDYSSGLAEGLAKRSEVLLFAPRFNPPGDGVPAPHESGTMSVFCYRQPRFFHPQNAAVVAGLLRELHRFKPDVVHFQGTHPWLWPCLPYLKRKYAIVTTVHDPTPHLGEDTLRARILLRSSIRFSDRIIVHGKRLSELTRATYKLPPEKVAVVPHGQLSVFKAWEKPGVCEEENTVLFFGRIREYKGLDYLVDAAPLVRREIPEAKFIVAGSGDLGRCGPLLRDTPGFELHNRRIPTSEVAALFQRASLVVLPYVEGSQSGVVAMAFAFGKPVVVTDVGSISEIVENGKTGLVVRARDSASLAQAIIRLLSDADLRRKMGEAALQFARTTLSWNTIADLTIGVYEEAIRSR